MIFTSHDHQFIQTIANRVIELKDNNDIIIVLWNDKYAGFALHCENWSCLAFFYEYLDVKNVEVIGNPVIPSVANRKKKANFGCS